MKGHAAYMGLQAACVYTARGFMRLCSRRRLDWVERVLSGCSQGNRSETAERRSPTRRETKADPRAGSETGAPSRCDRRVTSRDTFYWLTRRLIP